MTITSLDTDAALEVAVFLCSRVADVACLAAVCKAAVASLRGHQASKVQDIGRGCPYAEVEGADLDACCSTLAFAHATGVPLSVVTAASPSARSVLSTAAAAGRPDVVRFLLGHAGGAATANYQDANGVSALHYAALEGQDHVCNVLLEWGASPGASDKSGVTPLHLAAENGHAVTTAVLISARADVNACDEGFNTPLMLASMDGGNVSTCALLAAVRADITRPNLAGRSPIAAAKESGSLELCRVLLHPPPEERAFSDARCLAGDVTAEWSGGGRAAERLTSAATSATATERVIGAIHVAAGRGTAPLVAGGGGGVEPAGQRKPPRVTRTRRIDFPCVQFATRLVAN